MNGVSDADIIYEMLVEGASTRMLALFQDISDVELVGSIRSARHYTVQIAFSYDAILTSYGASAPGRDEIRSIGISHVDEGRQMLVRNPNRIGGRLALEHTGTTTGALATRWLPEYGFRLEHDDGFEHTLTFVDDGTPSGGSDATNVEVRFLSSKSSFFNYDADDRVYYLRQYNMDFVDGNDNSRPAFSNLLILKTSVTTISGSGGLRDTVTTGSGEGYFVSGGKYIEINWSRADKSSQFVYTNKDGSELELSRGTTYIGIIPTNMVTVFS
jgi:hypothetical protein